MKKIFELGNKFAEQSDWTDFALTKFCLCSMGILLGMLIPSKSRKYAGIAAGLVFIASYIPLMSKVFRIGKTILTDKEQN